MTYATPQARRLACKLERNGLEVVSILSGMAQIDQSCPCVGEVAAIATVELACLRRCEQVSIVALRAM